MKSPTELLPRTSLHSAVRSEPVNLQCCCSSLITRVRSLQQPSHREPRSTKQPPCGLPAALFCSVILAVSSLASRSFDCPAQFQGYICHAHGAVHDIHGSSPENPIWHRPLRQEPVNSLHAREQLQAVSIDFCRSPTGSGGCNASRLVD